MLSRGLVVTWSNAADGAVIRYPFSVIRRTKEEQQPMRIRLRGGYGATRGTHTGKLLKTWKGGKNENARRFRVVRYPFSVIGHRESRTEGLGFWVQVSGFRGGKLDPEVQWTASGP